MNKFFSWLDIDNYWRWLIGAHLVLGHWRLAQRVWTDGGWWSWAQAPFLGGTLFFMLAWLARAKRL